MHQKYTMTFSSNTNLVFTVALKIAGFFSIFKIIFHDVEVRIVILYLLFAGLKKYNIIILGESGWVMMQIP